MDVGRKVIVWQKGKGVLPIAGLGRRYPRRLVENRGREIVTILFADHCFPIISFAIFPLRACSVFATFAPGK
ncbi:hypothetical protein BCR43DRAFT_496457 [Syncephalastrum racemosum]|uniref:Uncharacterized protein n=1 Tax=Syncephalastrum racemosum TaxID=13706 RepID=A0A1X2H455_SYNRA|nr:hypothetical protein BCR43DRAFT_496457 [Syncephalastrum racemosum]